MIATPLTTSATPQTVESDAATLTFAADLRGARPLLLSEVVLILRDNQAKWAASTPLYQPSQSSQRAIEHATVLSRLGHNRDVIRECRQTLALQPSNSGSNPAAADDAEGGPGGPGRALGEFEMCQLANLLPDSLEEAKSLIPSLALGTAQLGASSQASPLKQGPVDDDYLLLVLDELAAIRRFSSTS